MHAIRSRTFRSGNSEAVRLPKEVAFGVDTEVEIMREGEVVTIRPVKKSMAWLMEQLRTLPAPDKPMVREPFEAPVRVWDRE